MVRPDPPVKKNCAQCGKPRNPKRNPYSGDQAFHDPFCGTQCCKRYFGVEFLNPTRSAVESKGEAL